MIFVQMFYDRFTGDDVPVISFSNWLIATLPSGQIGRASCRERV